MTPDQKQITLELSPGHPVTIPDGFAAPRYGFVKFSRLPNGDYRPIVLTHERYIRMNDDTLRKAGLSGVSPKTLRKLAWAGFLRAVRFTPKVTLLDLSSLIDHMEAVRDPGFWTPEREARFREAFGPDAPELEDDDETEYEPEPEENQPDLFQEARQ